MADAALIEYIVDLLVTDDVRYCNDPACAACRGHREEYKETAAEIIDRVNAHAMTFQERVAPWLLACFGAEISADKIERNYRFLEEALELVQASGCTASEAHQLVNYVYGRDQGEINQEVGGVMVTLAAHCLAHGVDMYEAAEVELARIWTKVEQIRAKQAAKPKHGPLPGPTTALAEIDALLSIGRTAWTPEYGVCRMEEAARTLRAMLAAETERAEKFKWQVRDTCARAEKAEAHATDAERDRDQNRDVSIEMVERAEAAESALAAAQAEIATLTRERDEAQIGWAELAKAAPTLRTEIARLTRERDEARSALEPFAKFAEAGSFDRLSDDTPMTAGSSMAVKQVTAGDFKRARVALLVGKEKE